MEKTQQEKMLSNQLTPAISTLLSEFGRIEYPDNFRYERYNYTNWDLLPKSRSGEMPWIEIKLYTDSERFRNSREHIFVNFRQNIRRIPPVLSDVSMKNFCEKIHQATNLPVLGMIGAMELYYDDRAHR